MRRFFTLVSIALYTGAVFLAGMLVVQLYALYVLVYTGAVFMIGLYVGERMERKLWMQTPHDTAENPESAIAHSEAEEVRESSELTLKKG